MLFRSWLEGFNRPDAAEREWLWYENSDFEGWLTGEVEAVEIDWALSVWGRWRRGLLDVARGEVARACGHLARVLELWSGADAVYEPLVGEARRKIEGTCGR